MSSDVCGDRILAIRSVAVARKVSIDLSLDLAAQRVASCTCGVHKTSPFASLGNRDGIRDDLFDRFRIGHTQELRISLGTDPYHSMSGSALPQGGSAQLKYRFALAAADRLRASSGTKAQSNLNPFPGLDKPPISAAVTPPETHPFFGMRFCAPDCIRFGGIGRRAAGADKPPRNPRQNSNDLRDASTRFGRIPHVWPDSG